MRAIALLLTFFLLARAEAQQSWYQSSAELVFTDPPFKNCHASTLVELGPGKLMLAFFGGMHEGNADVGIWLSSWEQGNWKYPVRIADGAAADGKTYPCWNPVLFMTSAGKLFLFYKVGPNPREWWGMQRISMDSGKTWLPASALPPGIIGPVKNKPLELADGTLLSPSSIESSTERWQVHLERSVDQGLSWQYIPIDTASAVKAIQPSILTYSNNRMQVLCRSNQNRILQSWSNNGGLSWGPLYPTTLLNPNSGTDALTLKSGEQMLVYNPGISGKEWFNNRAKLAVAVSLDGQHWTDLLLLENGRDPDEFSYPAIIQTSDGRVHITYTYNRKNIRHLVLSPGN